MWKFSFIKTATKASTFDFFGRLTKVASVGRSVSTSVARKKRDLIEWIFAKPMISGDSIWHYAKEQGWVHSEIKATEKRYKQIDTVRTWWDEWTYAWQQLGYKTRQYRMIDETNR
jgi:hypothetical protein